MIFQIYYAIPIQSELYWGASIYEYGPETLCHSQNPRHQNGTYLSKAHDAQHEHKRRLRDRRLTGLPPSACHSESGHEDYFQGVI